MLRETKIVYEIFGEIVENNLRREHLRDLENLQSVQMHCVAYRDNLDSFIVL